MKGVLLLIALCAGLAQAQPLPAAAQQALRSARLPEDALSVWLAPVDGGPPRLAWQAERARNPASLAKLVPTQAALELLGPAWRWRTPVWLQGRLDPLSGRLDGDVLIAGRGDPGLNLERVWLLLRELRRQGVRELNGDFLLDSRAFAPAERQPGDFDGEPWRPGNVQPEALLFNFKSISLHIRPDPALGLAWLEAELPLGQRSVPLRPGPCVDGRAQLRASWQAQPSLPAPLRLEGSWPSACGEQRWPLADADPAGYNARLLAQLWRESGGQLSGQVRAQAADAAEPSEPPRFEWSSPPLAELLRELNKHSNNLMAEQLALTLAWQQGERPATAEGARRLLQDWLRTQLGWRDGDFVWDRGSGLSRETRLTARQIGQLLARAWAAPTMPEFLASLPVAGVDGTLARDPGRFGEARGRAHLKTGSLRDVVALAGFVHARSGRRYLLVAMLEHPRAEAGRPALEALLRWAAED